MSLALRLSETLQFHTNFSKKSYSALNQDLVSLFKRFVKRSGCAPRYVIRYVMLRSIE